MERMPAKKLLFILLFILSTFSFFSLFEITIKTSTSIKLPTSPNLPNSCSSTDPKTAEHPPPISNTLTHYTISYADTLTPKEHRLLSNLISHRAPCNLLFFGLNQQFVSLSNLNAEGTTVFLEDDPEKLRWGAPKLKAMQIHKVKYHEKASIAYELLKHARAHPACRLGAGPPHKSHCKLALAKLPRDVYQKKWDVVVVDGPSGDQPEAPGRMGVIYTAAMIARAGNMTDVLVHDVDRIIERWYSWEFLCNENLVSSKGKFWHFRIKGNSTSPSFCPETTIQIE